MANSKAETLQNKKERQLGPVIGATLLTNNIDHVINAYQDNLHFTLVSKTTVSVDLATFWHTENLVGNRLAILAADNGDAWLRVVEDPNAQSTTPLRSCGWMALETNVQNVDEIYEELDQECFEVIGKPAYLQVSDAIKAMQVIGPANEVSYLTQVEREVPPFELPMTTAKTGGLFIPVLCTHNRDKSLAFYQELNNADAGLKFDTKITVLNKVWGHEIEHQYPVATLQLAGKCLFEIDQVPKALIINFNQGSLPSGIAMITCKVNNIENIAKKFNQAVTAINNEYYPGNKLLLLKGPAGELIELVG